MGASGSVVASVGDPTRNPTPAAGRLAPGTRVALIGISTGEPCGVRDHAALLAAALAEAGSSCPLHWLFASGSSLRGERAELRAWLGTISGELERERPDAVLLHYSVFAFAHRGVPLFVRPVLALIDDLGLPLVTFMHEFAYPWRLGGVGGKLWAATQRAALLEVTRRSGALVVSSEARADWLRTRIWLPRRPTSVAPVFSNLPAPARERSTATPIELGLFGYSHEGVDVEAVLDAVRLLRDRDRELRLELLGAPGRDSSAGARWERAAAARGLAGALGFSGRLPAQELADRLARCTALLFAERGGPTSRKTTLAASLASGRPVVALDGRNSWTELLQARAVTLAQPNADALAEALASLLDDGEERCLQGERGRAFARSAMSVERSASVVAGALARAIADAAG
jgi:glycosyltransferase involved in cell wall biosynthesis